VLKELKIHRKDLLRLLDYPNPDTLWDSFAEREGYDLVKNIESGGVFEKKEGEEEEEEGLLDIYEMESLREYGMAICEGKSGIYTRDFVVSKEEYEDLCGEELSEFGDEDIDLSAPGFCSLNYDERVCGLDRLVGVLHTHPSGAARPSYTDVQSHMKDRHKVMCISSPASNICWFTDPPEQAAGIPNISVEYSDYTNKAYEADAEYMGEFGLERESVEILPEAMIKGIDDAISEISRNKVNEGELKGVCFKSKTSSNGWCHVRTKDKGVVFALIK
jgi:hypothetical protein